jgi:hypothetical protein
MAAISRPASADVTFFLHPPGQTESEMKQDLFIGFSCMIAVGFVTWSLWGNSSPHRAPKAQVAHELSAELERVSGQGPSMRTLR